MDEPFHTSVDSAEWHDMRQQLDHSTADVIASKWTNRSSKPENVYWLPHTNLLIVDHSVSDISSPADTNDKLHQLPLVYQIYKDLFVPITPPPVDLQEVPPALAGL